MKKSPPSKALFPCRLRPNQGGTFSANPDVWWAVRSAGGDSFAKMHVTEVNSADRAFTVELFVQPKAAK